MMAHVRATNGDSIQMTKRTSSKRGVLRPARSIKPTDTTAPATTAPSDTSRRKRRNTSAGFPRPASEVTSLEPSAPSPFTFENHQRKSARLARYNKHSMRRSINSHVPGALSCRHVFHDVICVRTVLMNHGERSVEVGGESVARGRIVRDAVNSSANRRRRHHLTGLVV